MAHCRRSRDCGGIRLSCSAELDCCGPRAGWRLSGSQTSRRRLKAMGNRRSESRRIAYTASALCCASIVALPWTPNGTPLLVLWLIAGAGALGVFPCYYSFVQGLTERHPAKIFGILSFCAWMATSPLQKLFGGWIDSMIAAGVSQPFDRMMVA